MRSTGTAVAVRSEASHPGQKWPGWLVVGVVGVVAGGALTWAGLTVFTPPTDVLDDTAYTYVEVSRGEVGSSVTLNVGAEWVPTPVGENGAAGVLTSIDVEAGATVSQGSRLYSVNLRPTVAAAGAIPAFRTMAQGTTGEDVRQLQAMLTDLGYFASGVDGQFGSLTSAAVKRWQRQLGVPADGVVQPGDIVFLPSLPMRVALDPKIAARGERLVGGERIVLGLPDEPTFELPVTPAQAAVIPQDALVEMTAPVGGTWTALTAERVTDELDTVRIRLIGVDGAGICGEDCASLPPLGQTLLTSKVVTVPTIEGLVIPTAALLALADGTVVVIDKEGQQHQVTVLGAARGMSVIEGVEAGLFVRVPVSDS